MSLDEPASRAPAWRRDFPVASEGEDEVTRREFVRYLMLGSGAFAAGTVAVAGLTSARGEPDAGERSIVALEDLRVEEPHLFHYPTGRDPAILLLRPDGDLVAYSQKCTHLGCVVFLDAEADELVCPCHEGGFSAATGDVVFGPPERPLPRITLEVREGTVWAVGMDYG
ncbi:MAG TPA: ubiquinol-cytochrome c reductase iron-sulfur subunit [Acidimicrobiales bacterium]|nr:ubiquinol-cytochrome c reductase iron-sulfur subunit [Acidimicrobiales bacterium]